MLRHTLRLLLSLSLALPACAQDSMQRRGVSYWGQPAARQLYVRQPSYPTQAQTAAATAQASSKGKKQKNEPLTLTSIEKASVEGDIKFDIDSHGMPRRAYVHIPKGASSTHQMPVILVFHGMGMKAMSMPLLTMMDGHGDRYGFVIVYPDAVNGKWDDGFTTGDRGDVQFIDDLIRELPKVVNIDRSRVYACGISNGGFFSERLACDLADKIRAIGVVGATGFQRVLGRYSSPSVPAIFFLGTEDPLIPYDAGHSLITGTAGEKLGLGSLGDISGAITQIGGMMSGPQAIDYWVKRNGANPSPRTGSFPKRGNDPTRVTLEDYGSGRSEVAAYIVENGGHTWPGSVAGIIIDNHVRLGRTTQDIDASDLMCRFFASH